MQADSTLLFLNKIHNSPQETLVGSWEKVIFNGYISFMNGTLSQFCLLPLSDKTLGFLRCEVGERKYSLRPLIMLSY